MLLYREDSFLSPTLRKNTAEYFVSDPLLPFHLCEKVLLQARI